jgi:hypothetical protein
LDPRELFLMLLNCCFAALTCLLADTACSVLAMLVRLTMCLTCLHVLLCNEHICNC